VIFLGCHFKIKKPPKTDVLVALTLHLK